MAPKTKSKTKTSTQEAQQKPDWPQFRPLVPEYDLHLQELVPNQIVLVKNLWTSTLCKDYVQFLSSLVLETTPRRPKRGEAVRVNDRFQVEDAAFAARLWNETALSSLILHGALDGKEPFSDADRLALWGGQVVSPQRTLLDFAMSD